MYSVCTVGGMTVCVQCVQWVDDSVCTEGGWQCVYQLCM